MIRMPDMSPFKVRIISIVLITFAVTAGLSSSAIIWGAVGWSKLWATFPVIQGLSYVWLARLAWQESRLRLLSEIIDS